MFVMGFPGGSKVKNPPANVGDMGLIPGWGRSPEEGDGNPLQYSCLENPMDRGALYEEGLSSSFSGGGGKPSFPSPSAGDLRELPRV